MVNFREESSIPRSESQLTQDERLIWSQVKRELSQDPDYHKTEVLALTFSGQLSQGGVRLCGGRLSRSYRRLMGLDSNGPGKDWDFLVKDLEGLFGIRPTEFSMKGEAVIHTLEQEGWSARRSFLEGGMILTHPCPPGFRVDLIAPSYYQKINGLPDPIEAYFWGVPFLHQRLAFDVRTRELIVGQGALEAIKQGKIRVGNMHTICHEASMRNNLTPLEIAKTKAASMNMDIEPTTLEVLEQQGASQLGLDYFLAMHASTKFE